MKNLLKEVELFDNFTGRNTVKLCNEEFEIFAATTPTDANISYFVKQFIDNCNCYCDRPKQENEDEMLRKLRSMCIKKVHEHVDVLVTKLEKKPRS